MMASVGLSLPLIVATISLALLLSVSSLSWASQAGQSETVDREPRGTEPEIVKGDWVRILDELLIDLNLEPRATQEELAKMDENLKLADLFRSSDLVARIIKGLVKLSQKDSQSCSDIDAVRALKLGKIHHASSIGKYVKHFEKQFLSLCSVPIMNDAEESIGRIFDGHRRHLFRLETELRKAWLERFNFPEACGRKYIRLDQNSALLIRALGNFLNSKRDNNPGSQEGIPEELFQEHVLEPCKHWLAATDGLREIAPFVSWHADMCTREQTVRILDALNIADICQYIFDNGKQVKRKLHVNAIAAEVVLKNLVGPNEKVKRGTKREKGFLSLFKCFRFSCVD